MTFGSLHPSYLTPGHFKVGDVFSCEYKGKPRPQCEVHEILQGRDYLTVKTPDGYRNFKYWEIQRMTTLKLAVG